MKAIIAVVLYLMSPLCIGEDHQLGSDGYYFEESSIERKTFELTLVFVETQEELIELHQRVTKIPASSLLKGFTAIQEGTNKCTIYIIDPKLVYEPQYLGHELIHCIYGEFHNNQVKTHHGPFWNNGA